MLLFRPMGFPFWWGAADMIHVEEYWEDGMLVVCADLPASKHPCKPAGGLALPRTPPTIRRQRWRGDLRFVNAVNPVGSLGTFSSSLARPLAALLRGVERRPPRARRSPRSTGQIVRLLPPNASIKECAMVPAAPSP